MRSSRGAVAAAVGRPRLFTDPRDQLFVCHSSRPAGTTFGVEPGLMELMDPDFYHAFSPADPPWPSTCSIPPFEETDFLRHDSRIYDE